ncbi:MAG: hypothetical protein E4H29_06930 [Deltaproteobacteria bacterium]|nr:MAG: hypothetical protein E4H29_06930 [Deltaproteobacteria bacterium]
MDRIRGSRYLLAPALFLLLFSRQAEANELFAMGGGGEADYADIFVKEVKVSPVRAHVGEVIRIDMRWVYWGAIGNRYYETTNAEIKANGKVVASIPFVYDYGASLGDEYDHTYYWDTRGLPPGEYKIRGEVFLWRDATPYDNFLDVKEPVILLAPGANSTRNRVRAVRDGPGIPPLNESGPLAGPRNCGVMPERLSTSRRGSPY